NKSSSTNRARKNKNSLAVQPKSMNRAPKVILHKRIMKHEYCESAEVSDVGRVRKNNEDACLRIPDKGVYCVADGMGGVVGGDLASKAITTSLREAFKMAEWGAGDSLSARVALIRKAANQASKWIKNFADERVIGQMGSTVVALVFGARNPTRA